ncbi:MAG: hypothetical protein V3W34_04205 [Phycisphaerae bacterium]
MTVSAINRMILRWALGNNYEFSVCRLPDWPSPSLQIRLKHATIYFHNGRLVRVLAHSKGKRCGQMAREMASVFALCGFIKTRGQSATRSAKEGDAETDSVVEHRRGQSGISSVKSLRNLTASAANRMAPTPNSKTAVPSNEIASRINNIPGFLSKHGGSKNFGRNRDLDWR